MRINTNLTAMNTYSQYTSNNNKIASAVAKLSSGYAINTAADNAAGLAISEKMRAQIRGLQKSSANAQDAISLVQSAEGALSSSTEILQRMRELAVQSSSDTNNDEIDRTALQDEFAQLQSELDSISSNTTFNKKNLLDGSLAQSTKSLTNVTLAKSGLSVELGKAVAGSYTFSVGVQQESAAITGVQSTFTATSSDAAFSVGASVTNSLSASSLANGNYTISAAYDEANKQMTFTATNDSDTTQTFTATLNEATLTSTFGTSGAATLTFKNGSTTAFSFTVDPTGTYDTTSTTTMHTLASSLSSALTLSATDGVDAQDATYGLYASMTGAESAKLEFGMSSVSFTNGVKVNFNELSTAGVSTTNGSAMSAAPTTAAGAVAANGTTGYQVTYSNYKAGDNANITSGNLSIVGTAGAGADAGKIILTATNGATTYVAKLDSADQAGLNTTIAEGGTDKTLRGVTFTATDGTSFKLDITNNETAALDGNNDDVTLVFGNFSSTGNGTVTASSHTNFTDIFGTTNSTFDVVAHAGDGLTFQVGANEGDAMTINIDKMDANTLGVSSASVATRSQAQSAIATVDSAINAVSAQRATLGAIQNRLEYKIDNLSTSSENLTSAESQIRDVDMAKEMTNFTNANILQQAATAMLAQANSLPQNVLSLIGK